MGGCGSKEKAPPKENGGGKSKPEEPKEKPAEEKKDNKPTEEKKKDAPKEIVIPQGEPIKLDELDEDFILFEPIEEHYELGEEVGKYVISPIPPSSSPSRRQPK